VDFCVQTKSHGFFYFCQVLLKILHGLLVKNKMIYIAEKINDSTLVFLPPKLDKRVGEGQVRVEAAIIPFAKKNR